ncbi:clasp N terminal-domain-containing protein [Obelidium mucronatum]|nr:clasp N terminal-domain-containing protein [Obelidium mucronatum]
MAGLTFKLNYASSRLKDSAFRRYKLYRLYQVLLRVVEVGEKGGGQASHCFTLTLPCRHILVFRDFYFNPSTAYYSTLPPQNPLSTSSHIRMQAQIIKHDVAGVDSEINLVLSVFEQKESEDTWIQMDDAISKFICVVKGSSHVAGFVASIRKLKQPILVALNTERTRLSRTAMLLCEVLGQSLEERFDGLSDFILPALVRLCTRANKVIVTSANNTLKVIIDHAGVPSLLTLLSENICAPSPSKSLRISSAECVNRILGANSVSRLEKYVEALEAAIKCGTVDSTPEVRGLIKATFEQYKTLFPLRLDRFVSSLPEVAAKYLKVNKSSQAATAPVNRKIPPRPRAPTTTSNSSSGPSRQPVSRTTTITPDSYSTSRGMEEDDSRSLESETPSFALDLDEVDAAQSQKPLSKPFLELNSTIDAGKISRPPLAEHGTSSRRMLIERPSREAGLTTNSSHEHIGGAQRVPRELRNSSSSSSINSNNPSTASKLKALRVPATAPAVEQTAKSTAATEQTAKSTAVDDQLDSLISIRPMPTNPVPVSKVENRNKKIPIPKPPARPSSVASKVELLDLVQASNRLRSPEWTTRLSALESISSYIKAASVVSAPSALIHDVRSKASKYCEGLLMGLSDNQTKCIMAAISGLQSLIESPFAIPEMIDLCIPRIASIVFYQPQKSKSQVLELGQTLLSTAIEYFGVEACALACVHAIHNPEFGKLLKVRAGSVAMLAELSDEEWTTILAKSTNMKLYMTRLLSQATDLDHTIQKSLKSCLASMQYLSPDGFWNAWASAKQSEKKVVNSLFQTSDISFSKKELESARKSKPGLTSNAFKAATPQKITRLSTPIENAASEQKRRLSRVSIPSPSCNDFDERTATPSSSSKFISIDKSLSTELENTSASRASSSEGLSRLAVYEDSDIEELGDDEESLTAGTTLTKDASSSSEASSTPMKPRDSSDSLSSIGKVSPQRSQSVISVRSAALGSRIPASTSKIPMASNLFTSPTRSATVSSKTMMYTTGKIGKYMPLEARTDLLRPSVKAAPKETPILSSDEIKLEPEPLMAEKKMESSLMTAVEPEVSLQIAMSGDLEGLWLFAREKRNLDALELHLDTLIDIVLKKAKEEPHLSVAQVKCGIFILLILIEHFAVDGRAADVLLAALLFESKPIDDSDNRLELEYEVDSMLSTFRQTFEAKTLLFCVLRVLETTSIVSTQLCFELMTFALTEAKRIEGDGDDNVLFGTDEELEVDFWNRIIGFVVVGLDSKVAASRKSAFDCAVAMCLRKGEMLATQLFMEVGKTSGRGREIVVRGMVERYL